jgi:hypothetical protein
MKIHECLIAAMGDIGAVRKEQRNTAQGGGFNFRGVDDVVNAVSPAFRNHGVTVAPKLLSHEFTGIPVSGGRTASRALVIVEYTFTGPEGDTMTATVPGEAFDTGDKATAKAMSVAFRTALLQALALPTDEPDPDAASYERDTPPPQQPQGPAPQGMPGPRPWDAEQVQHALRFAAGRPPVLMRALSDARAAGTPDDITYPLLQALNASAPQNAHGRG